MNVLAVLQARMSSTRLPGKVLKDVLGRPMMVRQIERLRRARSLSRIVVATSVNPEDDAVEAAAGRPVFRGPLDDVLARYVGALDAFGADHVVRVTADCPLADWRVVDQVVDLHLSTGADYTSNTVERTFPKGLDVEIVRADLLRLAADEGHDPYEREHVTPFFYRRPERFRIRQLTQPVDESPWRWTVDTPADFAFAHAAYAALYPADPAFLSEDVRRLPGHDRTDPDDPGCAA